MAKQKLSIGGLARYALKSMLGRFGPLLGLCAPALLIVIASAVIGRVMSPSEDMEGFGAFTVAISIGSLLASVAMIPAFTGWHRLLILGDLRRENGRAFGWDRREWQYLFRMLQIWLAMFVAQLIVGAIVKVAGAQEAAIVGSLVVLAIYLAIWGSLGLGLPAAALSDPRSMGELAKAADGNVRRIAAALAIVWVAVTVVGMALGALLTVVGAALESPYLILVFGVMFYNLGVVASVGVLSRAYDILLRP